MGVNTLLPAAIRLIGLQSVAPDVSARFSCVSRHYRYVIWTKRQSPSPMQLPYVYFHPHDLDHAAMVKAAQLLLGQHDFSAFRAAGCQAKNPIRTIEEIDIQPFTSGLVINIKANAFLYHMVRIITGDLLMIGRGLMDYEAMAKIVKTGQRQKQMRPLPAAGLVFVGAKFAPEFAISLQQCDDPFVTGLDPSEEL